MIIGETMDATPPPAAVEPPRIPERFGTEDQPLALQMRFALGGEAINPGNTALPVVDVNTIVGVNERTREATRRLVGKVATRDGVNVWLQREQDDPALREHQAKVANWRQSVVSLFGQDENRAFVQRLGGIRIGDINFGAMNDAEAQKIYDRWVARRGQERVETVSSGERRFVTYDIDGFVTDMIAVHSPNGRLNSEGLIADLASIKWLATKIFGAEDGQNVIDDLIKERRLATDRQGFVNDANQEATKNENQVARRNWLLPEEHRRLTRLWEGRTIEVQDVDNPTPPGPAPRPAPAPRPEPAPRLPAVPRPPAPRREPLRPTPDQREFVTGESLPLEQYFARVVGNPFDANNPYYIANPPDQLPLNNVEMTRLERPNNAFFTSSQVPNTDQWEISPNPAVVPYVFEYGDRAANANQRFVNAEAATQGDSGLFALAAASAENPQRQAQLYGLLADTILRIHQNNPQLLRDWLAAQGADFGPVRDLETSLRVFRNYDNQRIQQGAQSRRNPQDVIDDTLIFTDGQGRFNMDLNIDRWNMDMGRLREALQRNQIRPHHLRWIEFLSHSVDVSGLMSIIKERQEPQINILPPNRAGGRSDEQELIRSLGERSPRSVEEAFNRYGDDLYDFLGRLTGYTGPSNDILRQIFVDLPGTINDLPPNATLRSFLYSRARDRGTAWLREKGWLDSLPSLTEPSRGPRDDIWKAAIAMPAFYRAVLILEELHSLTPTEKARALNADRRDLARLVSQARQAFNRNFDAQAQAQGRPTSDQINTDPRFQGLRPRFPPSEETTLFTYFPVIQLPNDQKQAIRRQLASI